MTDVWRVHYKTEGKTAEELANLLSVGEKPDDTRVRSAAAELRLREHRAILAQADAAERTARAAEFQAAAAERSAEATVRYTNYTRGLLRIAIAAALLSALAAAASWYQVLSSDRPAAIAPSPGGPATP